ncbi:4Fe-4S ferredoxin [Chromatiales bacterium (ex Bugula neritina AB1)]|nr:4Fe-4S ferredoxin [Chromatiales bacterium (ex Bugula neritina AB1)]
MNSNDKSTGLQQHITEAKRQVEICNACRYCEGYCAVFPAVNRQRSIIDSDLIQLANLCHNCQGCYHACQYVEPHEFRINLPRALADVRVKSWQQYSYPRWLADKFHHNGVAIVFALVTAIALLFALITAFKPEAGNGFYSVLSHSIMVALFGPAFIAPLIIIYMGLKDYWREINAGSLKMRHIRHALNNAATLKNLSGGQGQGCNFENGDRFSNKRRWLHQASMYGFLLCFASTSAATVMHYLLDLQAPYGAWSIPKLLGIPGGILLTLGCFGLAWLKRSATESLGATSVLGGEMAYTLLLGSTGATGLALYFATDTVWVPILLAIHLGTVLSLFLLMPYSKMMHVFFRLAALIRDAQQQNPENQPAR